MSVSNLLDPGSGDSVSKKLYVNSVNASTDLVAGGEVDTKDLSVTGTATVNNLSVSGGITFPALNANSLVSTGTGGALQATISSSTPVFSSERLSALTNQLLLGGTGNATLSAPVPALPFTVQLTYPGFSGVTNVLYSDFTGTQTINSGDLDVAAGNLSASTGDLLAKRLVVTQNGSQIVMGPPGTQTVVSAVNPVSPQTITIQDTGQPAANFVLSELSQVINGVKTFSDMIVQPQSWTSRSNSVAQSIPNASATNVQFDTAVGSSNFVAPTNTNTRFTPAIAGRYQVSYTVQFAASAVGVREVSIIKNGSGAVVYGAQLGDANAADRVIQSGSAMLIMNGTTDFFEVSAFQTSGGALNVGSTEPSILQATYLGP